MKKSLFILPLVITLLFGGGVIVFSQNPASCNGAHTLTLTGWGTTIWPAAGIDPSWSFSSIVVGNHHKLVVPSGQTVRFVKGGELEVLEKGELELSGVLTSCENEWKGVVLRGQVNLLPSDLTEQARFVGNRGKIENAQVAIYAGTQQILNPGSTTGAILGSGHIRCYGTEFLNNSVSISIFPYQIVSISNPNPPIIQDFQIGEFIGCKFLVDDAYSVEEPFKEHVFLERVVGDVNLAKPHDGIFFERCTFDMQQKFPNLTNRGILSVGSKFFVKSCSFKSLVKGIEATSSIIGSRPYIVYSSTFSECAIGIHNVNNTGARIRGNLFHLGDMPLKYAHVFVATLGFRAPQQVGIYFEGGTNGFDIKYNRFYGLDNSGIQTYGSYWRDLGANSKNMVTQNKYRALNFGNFAERFNGHKGAGLTYVCNENYNLSYYSFDFTAIDNSPVAGQLSMRLDQGLASGLNKLAPSLNHFSWVSVDFLAFGGQQEYRYYVPNESPSFPYFPKTYWGITLKTSDEPNDICGTEFKRFADDSRLTEEEKNVNLSNYFTNKGGYEQAEVAYGVAQTEGEKLIAQKAMVFYRQEMDVAAYIGYTNTETDTTTHDSLRVWMQRFENPTGDYMLVGDYISTKEYSNAISTLNEMPVKYNFSEEALFEHTKVADIYGLLIAADGEALSENDLQSLEEYADLDGGQARYLARSILTAEGYFFVPSIAEVELPNGESVSIGSNEKKLLISPNPVDYNANFDWSEFDTEGKEISIEITNQTGCLVQVLHPDALDGMVEWTTESVSGGICYYRLLIDGVEADAGFFIVNK